jgi:hypothetical protein
LRKLDFVHRSRNWKLKLVERSTRRFRASNESDPSVKVAEIPRPSSHQALIDWEDDEPQPLPPRFREAIRPVEPNRGRLLTAIAGIGALAVAGSLVSSSAPPPDMRREIASDGKKMGAAAGHPAPEAPLGNRIENAMADLPREDLNASEEKKGFIRSVRPDLMPPDADGLPAPAAMSLPGSSATEPSSQPPSREASREPASDEPGPEIQDLQDKAKPVPEETKHKNVERRKVAKGDRAGRRASMRAHGRAGLRSGVRRARANMTPVAAPATPGPFGPFTSQPSTRPAEPSSVRQSQPPG